VDRVVGEAINGWEKVRPPQPKLCDTKTGEVVDFLFLNRMRPIGETCLNHYLIPNLCRKAGVPQSDIRGQITSHRARSTIRYLVQVGHENVSFFCPIFLGHLKARAAASIYEGIGSVKKK
jgi:hypothetical protein